MKWQRSIIKSNAKVSLQGHYWVSFAACLVTLLLSGGIFSTVCIAQRWPELITRMGHWGKFYSGTYYNDYGVFSYRYRVPLMPFSTISPIMWLVTVLVSIFIGIALSVGLCRFFLHKRFGDTRFSTIFSGFKQNWGNTVGAVFLTKLFITLWSLLFFIPGIVKSYQYYYVEYLLADNPNLSGERARQLSRMLSDGEKGRLFVFDLSFFWWYVLVGLTSVITLGMSASFLAPYLDSARAELYIFVRDRAIQMGQLNPAELCLAPQQSPYQPHPFGGSYTANAQNAPYGNPQNAPYGNPQNAPYGNPQNAPYGNPQNAPYGNPQNAPYGNPQNAPYGNPQNTGPADDTQNAPADNAQSTSPADDTQNAPADNAQSTNPAESTDSDEKQ
jgi:uncharacterized membrane protein